MQVHQSVQDFAFIKALCSSLQGVGQAVRTGL